jgi:hypothetical protein
MTRLARKRQSLSGVFHFHELAVEDAISALQFPKVESYGDYIYADLHRIDFDAPEHCFKTHDVDFFLGPITWSPSIRRLAIDRADSDICQRNSLALGEGRRR